MGIIEEKMTLRREIRGRLKTLSSDQVREKSLRLCFHLSQVLPKLSKNFPLERIVLGAYAPMSDEVDIFLFAQKGAGDQFDFSFPDIEGKEMIFRQCRIEELIKANVFGVPLKSPSPKAPKTVPQILLIPGLAFSKEGHRLGRGRGFYDRYLSQYEGVKVGISFDEFLLENIPCEEHDIQVDLVVSESGIFGNIEY